ncbi:hypothetical protein [Natronomonas marina]|jgi:hypothetical protein|uniref:hypothetical protein n=1 Tax=Natronomonas marina TaxID=2961939 RepID=UPI0020C94E4A|nr:hypothetical protein [Natronomonas marina]
MAEMTERVTDRADDGLTKTELYAVVKRAVKDAILEVLGTVARLGLSLFLIGVGGGGAIVASSPLEIAVSAVLFVLGLVNAAVVLDVI